MTKNPYLKIKKLHPNAKLPIKANDTDLGYDLYCLEHTIVKAGEVTLVNTGIACNFPEGYGAIIRGRSSIATKKGIFVVAGIIDEAYTGEMLVAFQNPIRHKLIYNDDGLLIASQSGVYPVNITFEAGDKIAQMILVPTVNFHILEVSELEETERGALGFGSSGAR